MYNLTGIRISHISIVVPKQIFDIKAWTEGGVSEQELINVMSLTGISRVRKSSSHLTSLDLGIEAANIIFAKYPELRNEIDGVIFSTQTPKMKIPASSTQVQHDLGLKINSFCFDLVLACSAFPYAIATAAALINSKVVSKVLILAGDTLTKQLDPNDKSTNLIFGDAFSATIVETGDSFIFGNNFTDGEGSKHLNQQSGDGNYLKMDGLQVLNFSLSKIPTFTMDLINSFKKSYANKHISSVFLHQANKIIIESIQKKLKLPDITFPNFVKNFGNTSSASIPLSMVCHSEDNKVGISCLVGFGAGWSWGGIISDFSKTEFYPVKISDK